MAEFKKLSAVEAVEAVSDTANVLIEENGVIKRAAKSEIGAQADWAEMDENSPAFIKNKPEVGSSSTSGADIEFYLVNDEEIEIIGGSFENVQSKIEENKPVWAVLTRYLTGGSPPLLLQYHCGYIESYPDGGEHIKFEFYRVGYNNSDNMCIVVGIYLHDSPFVEFY